MPRSSGQKLLSYDRNLGARFVAGADEAGRGSLAGPLVVAGVLLDYDCLRNHRVRPLALSERLEAGLPGRPRGALPRRRRLRGADQRARDPCTDIDRNGLHRSNLWGLRSVLADLSPPAEACLVDGFRLGPTAPEHRAVVDGDTKSAAIAAASIVAKVTRDRVMRRLDALYPRYGFARHVGYITPGHSAAVREHGPSDQHRLSFNALAYAYAAQP